MPKCRHRKKTILMVANFIEFSPDDEPYESGKIESCGLDSITVTSLTLRYCPICEEIKYFDYDGIQEFPE